MKNNTYKLSIYTQQIKYFMNNKIFDEYRFDDNIDDIKNNFKKKDQQITHVDLNYNSINNFVNNTIPGIQQTRSEQYYYNLPPSYLNQHEATIATIFHNIVASYQQSLVSSEWRKIGRIDEKVIDDLYEKHQHDPSWKTDKDIIQYENILKNTKAKIQKFTDALITHIRNNNDLFSDPIIDHIENSKLTITPYTNQHNVTKYIIKTKELTFQDKEKIKSDKNTQIGINF